MFDVAIGLNVPFPRISKTPFNTPFTINCPVIESIVELDRLQLWIYIHTIFTGIDGNELNKQLLNDKYWDCGGKDEILYSGLLFMDILIMESGKDDVIFDIELLSINKFVNPYDIVAGKFVMKLEEQFKYDIVWGKSNANSRLKEQST